MPDSFDNARAYYDPTFPSSGDGFQIAPVKRNLQGLGYMDFIPLQPRAHSPADLRIMVRGRDASNFVNPVYYGDTNQRISFASGDSPTMSAPSANPRIDIVYMTPSGDLRIVTGTEAASPALPTLAPSGDTRLPICAIYHKVAEARIVNFEDKDSNTGDGYIYQDLRPFVTLPRSGATFSASNPISPTGDGQATPGTSGNAARADHVHAGVHGVRRVGGSLLQGDIEVEGPVDVQGNRMIFSRIPMGSFRNLKVTRPTAATVQVTFDELVLSDTADRGSWTRKRSITIDLSAAGLNGLDTGSEAGNTTYYIWIVRRSDTGAVGGVFSLASEIASLTFPANYDQAALVSGARNDGSSNMLDFVQTGREYEYVAWQTMASGSTVTIWTAISTTAYVPPALSDQAWGSFSQSAGTGVMTNDNTIATDVSIDRNKFIASSNLNTIHWRFKMLTANTLYYGSNDAGTTVRIGGFTINKVI